MALDKIDRELCSVSGYKLKRAPDMFVGALARIEHLVRTALQPSTNPGRFKAALDHDKENYNAWHAGSGGEGGE